VLIAPAFEAIVAIIGGIIIGALYGRFFEKVPGSTAIKKGILVGLVLWFLVSILAGLSNLRYGVAVYLGDAGVGIVTALLFGYLLGYFYGRFIRPPTLDPAMQGL
jgi:hypothetical protein